ncbi:MAG: class I SAM-dependent methyltransferase [Verrucomicrobiota bacterium]
MKQPASPSTFPETHDIFTASEEYAERFAGPVGAWMLRVQENIAMDMIEQESPASVLDIGGGHAQIAEPLARKGYDVTVLGSGAAVPNPLEPAIKTGSCRYQCGNIMELPFPDNAFDTVIAFRIFAHTKQPAQLIREMGRVARRQIVFDFSTWSSFNLIGRLLFRAKKDIEKNTRPWTTYRPNELTEAFRVVGFETTERKKQFFWPMALHRLLGREQLSHVLENTAEAIGLTPRFGSPVIVSLAARQLERGVLTESTIDRQPTDIPVGPLRLKVVY